MTRVNFFWGETFVDLLRFLHGLTTVLLAGLAVYCLRFRNFRVARNLAIFLILGASWALLALLIARAPALQDKILLNRAKMVAVSWLPLSIFATYASIQFRRPLPRWIWGPAALVPAISTLLLLSPEHERVITNYRLIPILGSDVLAFSNGTWFFAHNLYSRSLVIGAFLLLFWPQERTHQHHRVSRLLLGFGVLVPFLGDSLAVLVFAPLRFLQLTPTLLGFTGLVMSFAIFRFRVHEVVPFARNLVIEHSEDLVVITSPEHRVLDYNQRAAKAFDLSRADLKRVFPDASRPFPTNPSWIEIDGGTYEIQRRPLLDDGLRLGTLWHFKNISIQKKAIDELAAIARVKSLLLGVLGHDLQTHLASLRLDAEDLKDHAHEYSAEEIQAGSESIYLNTRACVDFVNEALAWSKGLLEVLKVQTREVALQPLIEQCALNLAALLARKELELRIMPPTPTLTIWTDPFLLSTVIRNLLSNAAKFSPPGSPLSVRLEGLADTVRIEVEDRGVGFKPYELEEIMTEGRPRNSQGLGLLICRDFVRTLGGQLTVDNRPGEGAIFTVTLPKGRLTES